MANSQDNKTQAPAAKAEPVYQWRMRRPDEGWFDTTKDEAYSRVNGFYEARTLYTAPVAQADDVRDAERLDFLESLYELREPTVHAFGKKFVAGTLRAAIDEAMCTISNEPADKEGK